MERFLEGEGRAGPVLDLERHLELAPDGEPETENEIVRPQGARLLAGDETQHGAAGLVRRELDGFHLPLGGAHEAVHRQRRVGRVRPEPREDDRHAAADRLLRREFARGAQEDQRPAPRRLEMRDMRAVQVDVRRGEARGDFKPRQPALAGGEAGETRRFKAAQRIERSHPSAVTAGPARGKA